VDEEGDLLLPPADMCASTLAARASSSVSAGTRGHASAWPTASMMHGRGSRGWARSHAGKAQRLVESARNRGKRGAACTWLCCVAAQRMSSRLDKEAAKAACNSLMRLVQEG